MVCFDTYIYIIEKTSLAGPTSGETNRVHRVLEMAAPSIVYRSKMGDDIKNHSPNLSSGPSLFTWIGAGIGIFVALILLVGCVFFRSSIFRLIYRIRNRNRAREVEKEEIEE